MILNMVGGGGSDLDFSVVPGSTRPTAPKENTIWANSKNSMGSWAISPVEPHRISKTRNLIVYPYLNSSRTASGLTFTVDNTSGNYGKVTVSGTNTNSGAVVFRLSNSGLENQELILQPGTYFLSGNCESSSSATHRLLLVYTYDNWDTTTTVNELENDGEFTLNKIAKARVSIQVSGKAAVGEVIYQPMLEKGSKSGSYTHGNATGQIWVKTDGSSNVLLNTIKKNGIYVQPATVYEYATLSGWVEREAEIYQKGAWSKLKTSLYVYNKGNSTGYSFACDKTMCQQSSGYTAEDRVTVGSTNITVETNSRTYDFTNIFATNSSGSFVKIDLSKYKTIRIKGTVSGATKNTACVFRALTEMGALATQNNALSQSFTTGTIDATVDISSVNSSCYLGFTFYNETGVVTFTMTELWLE